MTSLVLYVRFVVLYPTCKSWYCTHKSYSTYPSTPFLSNQSIFTLQIPRNIFPLFISSISLEDSYSCFICRTRYAIRSLLSSSPWLLFWYFLCRPVIFFIFFVSRRFWAHHFLFIGHCLLSSSSSVIYSLVHQLIKHLLVRGQLLSKYEVYLSTN